jgi:hypothetical protein
MNDQRKNTDTERLDWIILWEAKVYRKEGLYMVLFHVGHGVQTSTAWHPDSRKAIDEAMKQSEFINAS